jgi:outer membrane protein
MKKVIIAASLMLLALSAAASAQMKIGYVNSEAIMQQIPEAQDAQKQLDAMVADWQGEITKMQGEIQRRFEDYDRKKLIMSDKRRAEVEKEMQELDRSMVDFRTRKFGTNGELFTKQNELMKPIQDKVFKAIKDVADEEGYDYVFDKGSSTLLMYANEKHDITNKVIAKVVQK